MIKELVKMANHLDNLGHRDLADSVDEIISKVSSEESPEETDEEPAEESPKWGDEDSFDNEFSALVEKLNEGQADGDWTYGPPPDTASDGHIQASAGRDLIEKRASLVSDLSQLFIDESSFYSR